MVILTQNFKTPEFDDWIKRRVKAVLESYSVYDALTENGVELIDQHTDLQIACPFPGHGPDRRPSARYYSGGGRDPVFHCFKCKFHLNSIGIYSKFKNTNFMDALSELERRFSIRVSRKPDAPEFKDPVERGADYISSQWQDVPRMLKLLEDKLIRLRNKVPLIDFVKFCRVLDAVSWDFDHTGKSTPEMISALQKLRSKIEDVE